MKEYAASSSEKAFNIDLTNPPLSSSLATLFLQKSRTAALHPAWWDSSSTSIRLWFVTLF